MLAELLRLLSSPESQTLAKWLVIAMIILMIVRGLTNVFLKVISKVTDVIKTLVDLALRIHIHQLVRRAIRQGTDIRESLDALNSVNQDMDRVKAPKKISKPKKRKRSKRKP
ncbi:hypothetical protein ACI79G_09970 [Geodermatophilus sp. SYSU D00779]